MATVAVSVAGISFWVNQAVIGLFLGTAIFSIFVLSAVGADQQHPVPELSERVGSDPPDRR